MYILKTVFILQNNKSAHGCFYDLGLSFFSLYKASKETLATLTTLKRTPVNKNK